MGKFPSRPTAGFDGQGLQPFVYVRQPYDLHQFPFEPVEDVGWRRSWGKEPRPKRHLKVWHACLGHGGNVRVLRRALCRCDGQHSRRARLDMAGDWQRISECHQNLAAQHRGEHFATALVRDVLQRCAGSHLEELGCELKCGRRASSGSLA